jgi:glycosyltransferase involved in cell wall biosynthesis
VLINNGIETERFVPAQKLNGHRPLVGCFARVVPIKDITNFIEAAKIVLDKSPADFAVIGDIQDKEYYIECKKMVETLGISDHFKFVGYANPIEWYHKTDIFTLSSKSEGVPYALLEAMSCGLPCVCTDVGGVREILADGLGFVVPPGRPDSLAQAIHKLVADDELRIAMGRRATKVAREKYTLKQEAGHVFDLYRGLSK